MVRRSKRLNSEDATELAATNPDDVSREQEPTEETLAEASTWSKSQQHITSHLLPLISQQDALYSLLHQSEGGGVSKESLVDTCQQLFRCIEYLAELQEGLKKKDGDEEQKEPRHEDSPPCSLSGLHSLYTGIDESNDTLVDMETIWGQVDLQNNVLLPLLKKGIRKLAKIPDGEDGIRLLDMGDLSDEETAANSDEESDIDEGSAASMDEGSAASNMREDEESDGEMDEDARRIRERMEKAMADMDGCDDDFDENEEEVEQLSKSDKLKAITSKAQEMEDLIDPTREEMRDGFFDLHEMEAFADEEEEYLPDDAYGKEMPDEDEFGSKKKKVKKKVLPHIKARKGEFDSDSEIESDDDDSEDGLTKRFKPNSIRRKKYRADDEVEALYDLYNDIQEDDFDGHDDEGEKAPEDMTAADYFGKPDKKLIERYKSQHKDTTSNATDFDDTDSWDNHDFADDGQKWRDDDEEEIDDRDMKADDSEEEEPVEEEEESDTEQPDKLSAHAIQLKKLEQRTLQIEEDMMAEKPWRMKGESRGTDRPTDSLLDSTPEFEVAFKPPPIITAEHTASIEEVIKKRIIEEDWDDVVPRELPDIGLHKGGGDAPEVSQEKSKLGLGELYEREYLKKTTGFDRDAHEKETEEGAAKEEMKKLFADLCSKLDALSNYHFAPRPVADDADVIKQNVPAIAMEEVLPLHVSTSRGVAPEEVFAGGKGRQSVLKGESEIDQAERKKLRNAKKSARRKARKQKLADEKLISKLQPGLGLNNPYEKRKLREELQMARASGRVVVASEHKGMLDEAAASKEYQTSTKFFQKMQQNVEDMVRGDDQGGRSKKRRKGMDGGQASSSYKL